MLAYLCALLAFCVPPASPHAAATPPPVKTALSRFTADDQRRISDAAKDFFVDRFGRWWDSQVLNRHLELKQRPVPDQRQMSAFGLDGSIAYKTTPLWYGGAVGITVTDPEKVLELLRPSASGYQRVNAVFVCEYILEGEPRAVAERWVPESWAPSAITDTTPDLDDFYRSGDDFCIVNHTFKHDGDVMVAPLVREVEASRVGARTLRTLEVCPPDKLQNGATVPSPEDLAQAILDGKARLTEWRRSRQPVPDAERGKADYQGKFKLPPHKHIWTAKDTTPKPLPGK